MSIDIHTNHRPMTVPLAVILPSHANPHRDLHRDRLEGLADSVAQDVFGISSSVLVQVRRRTGRPHWGRYGP